MPNPKTPAAAEEPAIDPTKVAELRALSDDDEELFRGLVQMFLEDAPQALADLGSALAAANGEAVARVAHTLRGSCGYFGAHRLERLCGALEVAGHTGDLSPVSALITAASRELEMVTAALEAELRLSPP